MTASTLPNLIMQDFWVRPDEQIEADLATLRAAGPVHFLPEPNPPFLPPGPGAWAVVKHREILEASKHPEIFSSASGITVLDAPPEFNEFFSSMIAMDDPRHARLRRLVSAGFTPGC
jgi:cytochrome P450